MKKEFMEPSKKMKKPAKKVAQHKFLEANEKMLRKKSEKEFTYKNAPYGIAMAMNRSQEGYSKKPRVKPSSKRRPEN
jgi:hypothetical protein